MILNSQQLRIRTIIDRIVQLLKDYDDICPAGCQVCEEEESVALLPTEENFWEYAHDLTSVFKASEEGYLYLSVEDDHCPFFRGRYCSVYLRRPIDCRMFPLYPIFDVANNSFLVSSAPSYCCRSNDLPKDFASAVEKACEILNETMPAEWKILYNRLNARNRIMTTSLGSFLSL